MQFTVYRNLRRSQQDVPYLLDVQSDLLDIGTRMVVPLVAAARFPDHLRRLNPSFTVEDQCVIASTADLAAVISSDLSEPVTSLSTAQHDIRAALEFLLTGIDL